MLTSSPKISNLFEEDDVPLRSDEPKYTTPPMGSSTFGWLKKDLEQKADKAWVEAKLEALRDREEDTKKIAITAKERASMPHDCNQKETIGKLSLDLEGWGRWLRGILVSTIGFIILVGSGWLYQYFTLTDQVTDTQKALLSIEDKVGDVDASQRDLKILLEKQSKKDEEYQKIRIDEFKAVIYQAVKDINSSSDLRDTRRGR
jgi:hypothetical protein